MWLRYKVVGRGIQSETMISNDTYFHHKISIKCIHCLPTIYRSYQSIKLFHCQLKDQRISNFLEKIINRKETMIFILVIVRVMRNGNINSNFENTFRFIAGKVRCSVGYLMRSNAKVASRHLLRKIYQIYANWWRCRKSLRTLKNCQWSCLRKRSELWVATTLKFSWSQVK